MMRKGDWIQTYTGIKFWPLDPREEEVSLTDIAHALSNLCRFGGHTSSFYSVAQHCVFVSRLVPDNYRLAGLLHDAAEAYLIDIPRPIKRQPEFAAVAKIEARIEVVVAQRFGVDPQLLHDPFVKDADLIALATEARDLMHVTPNPGEAWGLKPPAAYTVDPWTPERARREYLAAFDEYGGQI